MNPVMRKHAVAKFMKWRNRQKQEQEAEIIIAEPEKPGFLDIECDSELQRQRARYRHFLDEMSRMRAEEFKDRMEKIFISHTLVSCCSFNSPPGRRYPPCRRPNWR